MGKASSTAHVYVVATKHDVPDALIAHGPFLSADVFPAAMRVLRRFDGCDPEDFVAAFPELLGRAGDDRALASVLTQLRAACGAAVANRRRVPGAYKDMRVSIVVNEEVNA